ncbi:ProQ/FINO family protein [Pectobacterium aroidearum]|uniref:ProQ/FINO family protein n=1 Tax=Pectobacterium aroidearum TaxID=1201031 RepID=UPI0030195821
MPNKKAPVIVVKKSRLKAPAAEPPLPEPHAGAAEAETPGVPPPLVAPDTATENAAPLTRKPFSRQAASNREKMAHFARTFPALWPDFDKGKFRPMKVGIKEQVKAYIDAHPDCGMTFGEWVQAVRVVTSRIEYQRCLKEGKPRYDIHGEPDGEVSAKDAEYARLRVARIKARLDAYRDAQVKQNDVPAE